ncbi:MAG: carbamoylphosphate synthase large subunit [Bacilli bacterium]|nr:carbamoylphosphate synthase large subunit [Bacilli bacterium]
MNKMNFVFVSPNFPTQYYKWTQSLKARGLNVLGIGDTPYDQILPELKESLTEYFYLPDLGNMKAMIEAVSYFEKKYGHIDYLESNNEWWLSNDATLREWFNIDTGFMPKDMEHVKAKSAMKEYFAKGGAKTMRYLLVNGPEDKEKAKEFLKEVGYPLFVKPNIGVGASDSYSLHNQKEFDDFFSKNLPETYIMEEYINGYIVSFDGICNDRSEVVFCTSDHFPTPIADIVNETTDYYYYDAPFELEFSDLDKEKFLEVGKSVVKAFGIRKRFFHIEFFVLKEDKPGLAKKGEFVALECNMRAPGGATPDLINYGCSTSVYDIYADVIAYNENRQNMSYPKYFAFASHRRDAISYKHSLDEIRERYNEKICLLGRYPDHIAVVMGNAYIYAKFEKYEDGLEFDKFVREKA